MPKTPYFAIFASYKDFVCKFAILRTIIVKISNCMREGEERGRGRENSNIKEGYERSLW